LEIKYMSKLKILLASAEISPLAKVGGLADVAGALPKALFNLGIDIRLVMPKYGSIDTDKFPAKRIADNIVVPFRDVDEKINIYETKLPDSEVPLYLIDNFRYLGKNGVYFETEKTPGGPDREAERFTFFTRSSLEFFKVLSWYPDIIHCQDWHVSLLPILLDIQSRHNMQLEKIKTLLTIHNLEYQGWLKQAVVFNALEINEKDYPTLHIAKDGHTNCLQQGILSADFLNTVSPAYAKEILTSEYGAGLEKDLQKRKNDLVGILNGIDVEKFNPATDPSIACQFTADDLSGKEKCKEDLQKMCGLETNKKIPILGIVTRLVDQKGIDLIYEISDELAKENMQFILLGTGSPALEKKMADFAYKYPQKVQSRLTFDAKFAQQIYAGSDIFLMPSRFEPCGLGQMIAMRYGAVPIARATGGLKDTVKHYDPATDQGSGFIFEKFTGQAFLKEIKQALALYQTPEKWYDMVKRIMQTDFSWNASAKKYLNLYQNLLKE